MAPPRKLVLVPGAIFRGNTEFRNRAEFQSWLKLFLSCKILQLGNVTKDLNLPNPDKLC